MVVSKSFEMNGRYEFQVSQVGNLLRQTCGLQYSILRPATIMDNDHGPPALDKIDISQSISGNFTPT
jgi:hypothetical protein